MKALKGIICCAAFLSAISFAACDLSVKNPAGNNVYTPTTEQQYIVSASEAEAADYNALTFSMRCAVESADPSVQSLDMTLEGALDIDTFSADVVVTEEGADGSGYIFIRDGIQFVTASQYENYQNAAEVPLFVAQNLMLEEIGEVIVQSDPALAYALFSLAANYGGVTLSGNQMTLDAVAFVKGVFDDVKSIVNSLTEETTILDIYGGEEVFSFMSALGLVADGEDVKTIAQFVLSTIAPAEMVSQFYFPEVESGQSAYDYVGALLNSEEFASNFGLDESFGSMKVTDLLNMSGGNVTIEQLQQSFEGINEIINFENGLTINTGYQVANISKASVTFTLNDDKQLVGGALEFAVSVTDSQTQSLTSLELSLGIELAEVSRVADVSGNSVTAFMDEGLTQTTVGEYLEYIKNGGELVPSYSSSAPEEGQPGYTEDGVNNSGQIN